MKRWWCRGTGTAMPSMSSRSAPSAIVMFSTRRPPSMSSPVSVDHQGAQGLDDALRNTPGVTQQTTSPFNTNTFVARGIAIDAQTNSRLNGGLPIINFGPMPIVNKERVELLKGASALYYGFANPSGIINLVTKRAVLRACRRRILSKGRRGAGRHQPSCGCPRHDHASGNSTSSNRYAPEGAPFKTEGLNLTARADYAFADSWSARVEGGISNA